MKITKEIAEKLYVGVYSDIPTLKKKCGKIDLGMAYFSVKEILSEGIEDVFYVQVYPITNREDYKVVRSEISFKDAIEKVLL